MTAVELNQLTKKYGSLTALDNVSLRFETNKIYGLLGRNGAGKTTLLNLINNRMFPSSGGILVNGEPVEENEKALCQLFYMTEDNLIPRNMRVCTAFRWAKQFYPTFDEAYAAELSAKFELDTNQKTRNLSTGYRSIVKLILTLASGAPVLIFDEPVLGLDAHHRDLFYQEVIARYDAHPCTMILSTHLIDEVAELIEQAVILADGRVTVDEPVESLLKRAHTVSGELDRVDAYANGKPIIHEQSMGKFKAVTIYGAERDTARAQELGVDLAGVNLQQLFIHLTNS